MKVVQINTLCGYAAPGRIATEIHQELIKKGHDSYVAYGRGQIRNIELNKAIKMGSKLGVFMHVLKTRIFDIPPGYTHNIENLGDKDMVTVMWVNEIYDPNNPDTYYMEV